MLALSMVVITGLIGGPGLGQNIAPAPDPQVDVGAAFDAGLAIVILAIVLDRLTEQAGEWLDPRERGARHRGRSRRRVWRGASPSCRGRGRAVCVAPTAARTFPTDDRAVVRRPGQRVVDWFTATFVTAHGGLQERRHDVRPQPARDASLTSAPWWLVIAVVVGLALVRAPGRRAAIDRGGLPALIFLLGLWKHAMETLANVLVATRRHARRSGSRSGS